MPRKPRVQPGGYVFHVINRGNARMTIFENDDDYAAFERVMLEAGEQTDMRLLAYCIMPNHWHLLLRPHEDGDLARYMHRLTTTHVRRWHQARHTIGGGHLYQGTYKSFPVQTDKHFLTVARYVERNPLRAKLVKRAEDWQWSSLWLRQNPGASEDLADEVPHLARWPVDEPKQWLRAVNTAQRKAQLDEIRTCIRRGRPFGSNTWQTRTAKKLDLESTFRSPGRPPNS